METVDGIRVDCELQALGGDTTAALVQAIGVDSDSLLTWLPGELLRRARIIVAKPDIVFVMANGETIRRSTGYAILRSAGFETVDEIVFGQPGDLSLLGSRTLEGFGAGVDARRRRLVASGPHLAA